MAVRRTRRSIRFIRANQPVVTRVTPHNGNKGKVRVIVPSRNKGGGKAPPP